MLRFFLVGIFSSLALQKASATVIMVGSGERFATRPDAMIGERLTDGYEYMARLQRLDDNLDLCPTGDSEPYTYNITVPPDGLPVVLLARGAYCSDLTKARMASINIHPPHVVKYLIIYDSDASLLHLKDIEFIHAHGDHTVIQETTIEQGSNREIPRRYTKDIDVYVLHTSLLTGSELLRSMTSQDPSERCMGGPRVLLDDRTSSDIRMKNIVFGVGIVVMISGCLCSFMLSMRLNELLGQEGAHAHAPRDPRTQLTADQVNDWLPPTQYQPDEELGVGEEHACSICLDEFVRGDAVRQLPCKHIFHDDCVAKWLTERSSTCPLCKLDLLRQMEEAVDETLTQPLLEHQQSFWQSLLARWRGTTDSSSISLQGGALQPLLDDYQPDVMEDWGENESRSEEESSNGDESSSSSDENEGATYAAIMDSDDEREHSNDDMMRQEDLLVVPAEQGESSRLD